MPTDLPPNLPPEYHTDYRKIVAYADAPASYTLQLLRRLAAAETARLDAERRLGIANDALNRTADWMVTCEANPIPDGMPALLVIVDAALAETEAPRD